MVWMGLANETNPTKWGWKHENNPFVSIWKECCASRTLEKYPLQLFGGMQILSMQLQTLWTSLHCCMWPLPNWKLLQSSNTQEVDTEEEEDGTQNWTLWNLFYVQRCLCIRWWQWTAEGHEFNFVMIQQFSDIQSCLNVFLASINLRIDT